MEVDGTENYQNGWNLYLDDKFEDALRVFQAEPNESQSYGMAQAMCALIHRCADRPREALIAAELSQSAFEGHGCAHPPTWIQLLRTMGDAEAQLGHRATAIHIYNAAGHKHHELVAKHPQLKMELDVQWAHVLNSWGAALMLTGGYSGALDVVRRAVAIYREHESSCETALAYALTTLGQIHSQRKDTTAAWAALSEARDHAQAFDEDQVVRVEIAMVQLDPHRFGIPEAIATLKKAISKADADGHPLVAYTRCCALLKVCGEGDVVDEATRALEELHRREDSLEDDHPYRGMVRLEEALQRRKWGASNDELLKPLVAGAAIWYDRFAKPWHVEDLHTLLTDAHDHFRFLASVLVQEGRADEALVAFEAGRAVVHAAEISHQGAHLVLDSNPFIPANNSVSTKWLGEARSALAADDCCVTIALLQDGVVAFVLAREGTQAATHAYPSDERERDGLSDSIEAIPYGLRSGHGIGSLPEWSIKLAKEVVALIDGHTIRWVFPHAVLHEVPWRELFGEAGARRDQLATVTGFGLVPWLLDKNVSPLPNNCVALGNGRAGAVDLNDEAKKFAATFKDNGRVVENAHAKDVREALASNELVLISCHGVAQKQYETERKVLHLALADGAADYYDLLPEAVAAPLIALSACFSGVYQMGWGDYPDGAAPELLRKGARAVICCRYEVNAQFAARVFTRLAAELHAGKPIHVALRDVLAHEQSIGTSRWPELACIEVVA